MADAWQGLPPGPIPQDKPGFIGPIPLNWNCGLGFSAEGFMAKPIMQKKGGKPSISEKIFASIMEDCKKVAAEAGVMYSGDLPSAPSGGFSANISGPSGGGMEIG